METTTLVLEAAKVLATVVAAGVAAWVTYKIGSSQRDIASRQAHIASEQKRIAAAKLNLELFEQRYELFQDVWHFLSQVAMQRNMDDLREISNSVPKARFLFGEEIANYMKEADQKQVELAAVMAQQQLRDRDVVTLATEHTRLQQWFWNEASNCFQRFSPYLDFSHWRTRGQE